MTVVILNVVVAQEQIVLALGWAVIAGAELIVKLAVLDVAFGVHPPVATARYKYPLNPAVAPVIVNVAVVAPEYGAPLLILEKPAP